MRKLFKVKVNGTAYDVEVEEVYETATISAKPITSTIDKTPETKISTSLKEIFDFDKAPTPAQSSTTDSPSKTETSAATEISATTETSSWAAMPSSPAAFTPSVSETPASTMPAAPTWTASTTPPTLEVATPTASAAPESPSQATPSTPTDTTHLGDSFLSQYQQLYSETSAQPSAGEPEISSPTPTATSTLTADSLTATVPSPATTTAKSFELDGFPEPPKSTPRTGNNSVLAPMQGTIVQIPVRENSAVHYGDVLCVISSNGIESEIMSPVDAEVVGVYVRPGSLVNTNDILITLT